MRTIVRFFVLYRTLTTTATEEEEAVAGDTTTVSW